MFELDKTDLHWLEDKFERYNQFDREIAIRKQELDIKEPDFNVGGGKSNIPSSPVENKVIKYQSDAFIKNRQNWKKAIKDTYIESESKEQQIIREKYWGQLSYLSWEEIGQRHNISKSQAYRLRYTILEKFAKKIGYI